jgi:hypothetical protein
MRRMRSSHGRRKGDAMKKTGILVCVAILVMTVGAALGCGDGNGSTPGMTPKQVVDAYMRATVDLDVDAAYDLLSKQDKKNITKEQMQAEAETASAQDFELSYVVGEETINGDEATVEVNIKVTDNATGDSQEVPQELNLVKEEGDWKIYFGDSL